MNAGLYTRATYLLGLDDILREKGADLANILAESGLPPRALHNVDMLIPSVPLFGMLERIAHEYAMPTLGIDWTRRMAPHHPQLGPMLAIARFSRNMGEWFDDAITYWGYHTNAFTLERHRQIRPGVNRLRFNSDRTPIWSRQFSEHAMANLVSACSLGIERPDLRPIAIHFTHSRPDDISVHQDFFDCPIEFGCEHNEMEFSAEYDEVALGSALTPLRPIVRRYVQNRIRRLETYNSDMTTHVGMAVSSLIGSGRTDLASISEALMVHPKQLQRMLAEEGTSFSDILDHVRKGLAQDMVAQTEVPMGQIAGLLGYSAHAPFTTAFRKWTGMAPMQWRKHKGGEPEQG
jgi:AraC-like DNA-binding protein